MGWCGGPCRYQSLWSRAVGWRASLRSDGLGGRVWKTCLGSNGDWDCWAWQYMAVGTDAGPTTLAAGQIYDESSRPMLAACWAWREVLEKIMLWGDRGIASQTDPFRVPCIGGWLVDRGPG